jgi:hypothetical protein
MTASIRAARKTTAADLRRILEPLAGYICATDRPAEALKLAYATLLAEVAQVNRAARGQMDRFDRPTSGSVA